MKRISTLLLMLTTVVWMQAQEATPLSEAKFEVLRKDIVGQSFDSKRIVKAKELSDAQFLYVNQIRAIMEGFVLESNRLEYAKYAYSTVLDAENYEGLVDLFKLGTAKEELKSYLSQRQAPVVPKSTEKTEEAEKPTEGTTTTTVSTTVSAAMPTPMNDQDFAAAKRQLEEESFESSKLRRAKQISDANYTLCSQVKEIVDALNFESSKLEYAKYAYAKTYDQANYEIVKEGVRHSKSKDEMTAFLKKQPVADYTLKEEVVETPIVEKEVVDATEAPAASKGIAKSDFMNAKKEITGQSSDAKKLEKAKEITDRTYLSTAQVGELVELFLFEDNRLEYAKHAYPKTTDQDNFTVVKEKLEKESHKLLDDYIRSLEVVNNDETVATGPSELSSEDFEALKKRIKGAALESHKLEKAKKIVDRSKVSAMQVKQINELFELEESRLEFAKYAYSKTLNKEEYEMVRKTLDKSTSKYSLDRFIKGLTGK